MSMYLPNDDVEPTGEEAAEFLAEPVEDEETEMLSDEDDPGDPAPDDGH